MSCDLDRSRSTPLPPATALAALIRREPAVSEHLRVVREHGALRIATICSGTEAPIIALKLMQLPLHHLFSCEIEPVKQAYIYRNFAPDVLFRDVRDLGGKRAPDAWGVMHDVPNSDVDMLVAGTSCVDFSKLNPRKKGIRDGGESGKTFEGMLAWVAVALPRMVVLENVCGAPWDIICSSFELLGYKMETVQVDSKHYLVPQTRVRGYAIGFRTPTFGEWAPILRSMAWPGAQPTLSSYILPGLADEVLLAKRTLTAVRRKASPCFEWTRCERRHKKARTNEELGQGRPCTGWAEGGLSVLRDGSWGEFATYLGPRKSDLLDINYLRHASRGRDALHRTCVWNLQQNVNWETGHTKQEVCPCLTPGMLPWVTNQGRPLIGVECLHLQGIPTDTLSIATESNPELMDLAGNAMTVTVVGCALAAGLLCGGIIGGGQSPVAVRRLWRSSASGHPNNTKHLRLCKKETLCDLVAATSPLCLCTPSIKDYVQCEVCAHTACSDCGHHPLHSYSKLPDRQGQSKDVAQVEALFPICVELRGVEAAGVYYQCTNAAGVASWHVTYDTHPPTKELQCTVWTRPSPRVVWAIGDLCLEVGGNCDIMTGRWTVLAVPRYSTRGVLAVTNTADIVGGWLQTLGARGGGTRPTSVEFQGVGTLSGVYNLASDCDAPCNSLYVRTGRDCWFVFDPQSELYVFTRAIGFQAALRVGFCDPCVMTDLSWADFAALTRAPLSFRYFEAREKCTGASLHPIACAEVSPDPPMFGSNPTCGRFSCVPGHHVAGSWREWSPLPAHAGETCEQCIPADTGDLQAMMLAWHARPPPLVAGDGLTIGVDPIALQHRARRMHPTGVCHYRIARRGPLPRVTQHKSYLLCSANPTGPTCEAQPEGMQGSGHELRLDQRLVVAWAQDRESSPTAFLDEFILEERGLSSVCLQLRSIQGVKIRGGVLADGVGYGKTIVALSLVTLAAAHPTLVIAPGHLLRQWASEAMRLFPRLRTTVISSSREASSWVKQHVPSDVLITTGRQLAALGRCRWARLIVDEYTFLDQVAATRIVKLGTMPRWLLSATPSVDTRAGLLHTARLLGHSFGFAECASLPRAVVADDGDNQHKRISEKFAKLVAPSGREANAAANRTIARFCAILVHRSEPQTDIASHQHHIVTYHVTHAERVLNTLASRDSHTMTAVERMSILVSHGNSTDRLLAHFSRMQLSLDADETNICQLTSKLAGHPASLELSEWFATLQDVRDAPDAQAAHRILRVIGMRQADHGPAASPQNVFFQLLALQKKHAAASRTIRYIRGCCTSILHPCDACGLVTHDLVFATPCLHLLCNRCSVANTCGHSLCGMTLCTKQPPAARHVLNQPAGPLVRSWGAAIQCLLDTIEHKIPRNEGCIVFYQGAALGDFLEGALSTEGLQVRVLRGSDKQQSKALHEIQTRQADASRCILLLHLGTAEAAGSNLTCFCYSIFVHTPVAVDTQAATDVQIQAIGRTLRFGQHRPVTTFELRPDYEL